MTLPKLSTIAKELATLVHYREGNLLYQVVWYDETGSHNFQFPVPISDSGEGAFLPVMKGVTLMRWMRKHLEFLQAAQAAEQLPA